MQTLSKRGWVIRVVETHIKTTDLIIKAETWEEAEEQALLRMGAWREEEISTTNEEWFDDVQWTGEVE